MSNATVPAYCANRTHLGEFPDCPIEPTILRDLIVRSFTDTSWHNDTCPSFFRDLSGGNALRLWVDYRTKSLSETPDGPRFGLSLITPDDENGKMLYSSDTWTDTLEDIDRHIVRYVKRFRG